MKKQQVKTYLAVVVDEEEVWSAVVIGMGNPRVSSR